MTVTTFDPPGNVDDLDPTGRTVWSQFLSDTTNRAIAGNPANTFDSPRAQYYNPTETKTANDVTYSDVSWIAFPRQVKVRAASDRQRWTSADASRDVQDEYCEWSVSRDSSGKITRVTFTCEGPEYWEVLAQTSPDTVVDLYQQHVSELVQKADLFDASGNYIPRNRWNSDTHNGAMHLVQAANTLGAEIELCAAATIVREINGEILTGEQELIKCSQYGAPQRNSDPHIGGVVNATARAKSDITLANPVGLYFDDLSVAGWSAPDGSDPKSYWSYTRGESDHPVRAVFEVPVTSGFVVGDLKILGKPISFASQIADFISIKATVQACRLGQSTVLPMTSCVSAAIDHVATFAVEEPGFREPALRHRML